MANAPEINDNIFIDHSPSDDVDDVKSRLSINEL